MTQSAELWRILNVFIRNNIVTARIEFAFADFTSPLSSAKPPNGKGRAYNGAALSFREAPNQPSDKECRRG